MGQRASSRGVNRRSRQQPRSHSRGRCSQISRMGLSLMLNVAPCEMLPPVKTACTGPSQRRRSMRTCFLARPSASPRCLGFPDVAMGAPRITELGEEEHSRSRTAMRGKVGHETKVRKRCIISSIIAESSERIKRETLGDTPRRTRPATPGP